MGWTRVPPTAWLDWCWRGYLATKPPNEHYAMGACDAAKWRALDGAPPPAVIVLGSGDPLRDAGAEFAATYRAAGAAVAVVETRATHCGHPIFDKPASTRALEAYGALVSGARARAAGGEL